MKKNLNLIKSELQQFCGTDQMYFGINKNSIYTDGFKYFIAPEQAGAYWFYDIIQTEVYDTLKKHGKLDVFYLTLDTKNEACDIILKDYKNKVLFKRHIGYTDAPSGEITFICGWDGDKLTTCLISEN